MVDMRLATRMRWQGLPAAGGAPACGGMVGCSRGSGARGRGTGGSVDAAGVRWGEMSRCSNGAELRWEGAESRVYLEPSFCLELSWHPMYSADLWQRIGRGHTRASVDVSPTPFFSGHTAITIQ